jgi:hypothetical protein
MSVRPRFTITIVLLAVLAGCAAADSTAPVRPEPTTLVRDAGDSVPNPLCRSGYSSINGRCLGDE